MNRLVDRSLGGTLGRRMQAALGALTLLVIGAGSCTDGTTTVAYAYDDPYVYTTYYPVDTSYAGYYWADSWNYYAFYYEGLPAGAAEIAGLAGNYGPGGHSGEAGATGTGGNQGTA